MSFTPLPEAVHTLYAELLDQLRAADADAAVAGARGSFVSKRIRGRTYWYLQQSEGERKRQIYVGAETPELLARMRESTERRTVAAEDGRRRRDLVAMLAAGGVFRDSAPIATVLEVLAGAGVFRAGGVLIGTQAFTCMANMLGFRAAGVTHDTTVSIAFVERQQAERLQPFRRAEAADPRGPSTFFTVHRRDFRVDFLTADKSHRKTTKPVFLPHLGIAAQPLRGVDYLIDDAVDAAVVARHGIRVNIPTPGRFALHKLWEASKAKKDVRQATQIIEVLLADRPEELVRAYKALASRPSMLRSIDQKIRALGEPLAQRIGQLLR